MATRKAASMALVIMLGSLVAALYLGAAPGNPVAYPQGYRNWTHVKSALIGPQSPFYKTVGGLHHIYANEKAMQGYRTGRFPDGSVLVFDLFETRETEGTTIEGPRRHIDVMEKDSKRFSATGGWGYEEFKGDSQTERALTTKAAQACHSCHEGAKNHDSVFSRFRK
ncbi:MAG: cytochrome P460 family protein [Candidatus Acidiferrales bacterium]